MRRPISDRGKLQDLGVAWAVRRRLADIPLPSNRIEQSTRSFIECAPFDQRSAKQHWVSQATFTIIQFRDWTAKKVRRTGIALKKLVAVPLEAFYDVA